MMFNAAIIQMRSGKDVETNIKILSDLVCAAAAAGAQYVQTPEMSHLLCSQRDEMLSKAQPEDRDKGVQAFCELAKALSIYLHIGSLALKIGEGKLINRALLFAPSGQVLARYDKIHMFDVELQNGEKWQESTLYQPGKSAVVADLPWLRLGISICYDIRFPYLFRDQAQAGAMMMSAPAAFTRHTGSKHWHVLQRARAIETGSFIASAAQAGRHEDGRTTYGHALIASPEGHILAECDSEPAFAISKIDPELARRARKAIPAWKKDAIYSRPSAPDTDDPLTEQMLVS